MRLEDGSLTLTTGLDDATLCSRRTSEHRLFIPMSRAHITMIWKIPVEQPVCTAFRSKTEWTVRIRRYCHCPRAPSQHIVLVTARIDPMHEREFSFQSTSFLQPLPSPPTFSMITAFDFANHPCLLKGSLLSASCACSLELENWHPDFLSKQISLPTMHDCIWSASQRSTTGAQHSHRQDAS